MTTTPAHVLPLRPQSESRWRAVLTVLGTLIVLLVLAAFAAQSLISWGLNRSYTAVPAQQELVGAQSVTLASDIGDVVVIPGDVASPTVGLVPRGQRELPAESATARARIDVEGSAAHPNVTVSQPAATGPIPWEDDRSQILLVLPAASTVPISVQTDIGDIRINDVGGRIDATSGTGDIMIDGVPADSQIEAVSNIGDVVIQVVSASPASSITTSSDVGDIEVLLPESGRWSIDTTVQTGEVRIDPDIEASASDGTTPTLTIRSDIGSIWVHRDTL